MEQKRVDALMEREINLAEYASDIILYGPEGKLVATIRPSRWTNMTTGKTSEELQDVVDGPFLILHERTISENRILFKYFEDEKVLYVIRAKLILKDGAFWQEQGRRVYAWEDGAIVIVGERGKCLDMFDTNYDIAGQSIIWKEDKDYIHVGDENSLEELEKFFCGLDLNYKELIGDFFYPSEPTYLLDFLANNQVEANNKLFKPLEYNNEDMEYCEFPMPDPPKEAFKRMENYCMEYCLYLLMDEEDVFTHFFRHMPKVAICQRHEDDVYLRIYMAIAHLKYPVGIDIKMVETKRYKLKCENGEISNRIPVNKGMPTLFAHLVYSEVDFNGTNLQYCGKMLNDWSDMIKESLKGEPTLENVYDYRSALFEKEDLFFKTYGITPRWAPFIAVVMAENEFVETIFTSVRFENFKNAFLKYIKQDYNGTEQKLTTILSDIFGRMDFKSKTIHGKLCVPKGVLDIIIDDNDRLENLEVVKTIFGPGVESEDYFLRMNKDDCRVLMDFIQKSLKAMQLTRNSRCIRTLITIYGAKNWKAYIEHIAKENESTQEMLAYCRYIQKLEALGDRAKKCEWKLSGDNLKKADESLEGAYRLAADNAYQTTVDMLFKSQMPRWETYLYESGDFQIIAPRTAQDIIDEGVCLCHCVKNFVEPVSEGKTTILFVRKKEELERPFFTLEIRNDGIHQCHGFDNKNIDTIEGLEEFLKGFCKEKDIAFERGENLYGI